jgi:hypothetical protein
MSKTIDYLTEDIPIPSQSFALVSIIGPGMKGKCDVYGLKVRGVTASLDEAKGMSKRIMQEDNLFDIYTVPVGKFFPLDVSDDKSIPVEYQNQELNSLMKSYVESTKETSRKWNQLKEEQVQEARASVTKKEHIYTVHNTILNVNLEISKLKKDLLQTQERLVEEEKRMESSYTTEQKQDLQRYLAKEMTESESKSFLDE